MRPPERQAAARHLWPALRVLFNALDGRDKATIACLAPAAVSLRCQPPWGSARRPGKPNPWKEFHETEPCCHRGHDGDGLTIGEAQPIQAAEASLTASAPAKRAVPGVDHAGMRGMPGGLDSCADMMRGSR